MRIRMLVSWPLLLTTVSAMAVNQGDITSEFVFERHNVSTGVLEFRTVSKTTYDSRSHPVQGTNLNDYDGDGVVDQIDTMSWNYDKRGQPLSFVHDLEFDGDSTVDWHSESTFTNLSKTQTGEIALVDWDSDGITDYTATGSTTFDKHGRLLSAEWVTHFIDGSFPDMRYAGSWWYDGAGNQSFSVEETDYDDDGIPEVASKTTSLLNKRGQPTSSVTDGFDNQEGAYFEAATFSYDKHGDILEMIRTHSATLDGPADYVDTLKGSYVGRGKHLE